MNKLFGKSRKDSNDSEENGPTGGGAESMTSETDSLQELRPMFVNDSPGPFTNDKNLNLNPSISAIDSLQTERSSRPDKSLFSSRVSRSTKQSSNASDVVSKRTHSRTAQYGQQLQILETTDESNEWSTGAPDLLIKDKLRILNQDIAYFYSQYTNSLSNLSTTVVGIINCLKDHISFMETVGSGFFWNFNSYNNDDVRKILKMYLHFYDNLLQDDAYMKSKLLFCKTFNYFTATLKSDTFKQSPQSPGGMTKPCNFAIGVNDGKPLKNEDAIYRIMEKISNHEFGVNEQNGSFIAPIARGISKDMNVICLYFGYRTLSDQHSLTATKIHELYDDIHVIVAKNRIELAAAVQKPISISEPPPEVNDFALKFKLPFRSPTNCFEPPMSLSISVESSSRVSGTMGGFLYPIIDNNESPHLSSYANSKFAISCGHVCLESRDDGPDYPYICSPSSVLIGLYKNALTHEYDKLSSNPLSDSDSRAAYSSILNQLDVMFPPKKTKVFDHEKKQETVEIRNLPKHRFGQIIWGERTLTRARNSKDHSEMIDKRLSDLAIIKVNKSMKCNSNFLGDDIAFNEFDPALMFENLYVRKVVSLRRLPKEYQMSSVKDVDSSVSTSTRYGDGSFNLNGLPVFKYGSTTRFTKGNLNGIKLVYWMDGAIHSSEFVVNSLENTTSFAAGGDSGAWILTKLEDVKETPENKGLGVVGMLHSYDGEYRQFGLFTPMHEILDRLEEVTKIKWEVVGVPNKGDDSGVSDGISESELDDATSESDISD